MNTQKQHNRLDDIESAATAGTARTLWGPVQRPAEAPEDAGSPPGRMPSPVWHKRTGWISKRDLQPPIIRYGPDPDHQ
jgi:hypothetical protein